MDPANIDLQHLHPSADDYVVAGNSIAGLRDVVRAAIPEGPTAPLWKQYLAASVAEGETVVAYIPFTHPRSKGITEFIATFDPATMQVLLETMSEEIRQRMWHQASRQRWMKSYTSLTLDLAAEQRRAQEAEAKLAEAQAEIQEFKGIRDRLVEESRGWQAKANDERKNAREFRDQLAHKTAECRAAQSRGDRLVQSMNEFRVECDTKVRALTEQLQLAESQIAIQDYVPKEHPDFRVAWVQSILNETEASLVTVTQERDTAIRELDRVLTEVGDLRTERENSAAQRETVRQLAEARTRIDSLQRDGDQMARAISKRIEETENLRAALEATRRELADERQQVDRKTLAHIEHSRAREEELERTRALLAGVSLQLDNAKGEHRDEMKRKGKEMAQLRLSLDQACGHLREAQAEITSLRGMAYGLTLPSPDTYEHMFGFATTYDVIPQMVVDNERLGWRLVQIVHIPAAQGYSIVFGRKRK